MELFLRFPDGQAVLLSRSELQTPDGPMTQILVKDVTAEDSANRQLQEQNALLKEQGGKIKNLLGGLEKSRRNRWQRKSDSSSTTCWGSAWP